MLHTPTAPKLPPLSSGAAQSLAPKAARGSRGLRSNMERPTPSLKEIYEPHSLEGSGSGRKQLLLKPTENIVAPRRCSNPTARGARLAANRPPCPMASKDRHGNCQVPPCRGLSHKIQECLQLSGLGGSPTNPASLPRPTCRKARLAWVATGIGGALPQRQGAKSHLDIQPATTKTRYGSLHWKP